MVVLVDVHVAALLQVLHFNWDSGQGVDESNLALEKGYPQIQWSAIMFSILWHTPFSEKPWMMISKYIRDIYIIVNHHKWKIKILQTLHPFSLNKGLPSDRWAGALQSVLFCDRSLSLGFPWSPFPHWRCLIYLGEGVVFWLDALQVSGGIYYPATTTTKLLHTGYFRPLPSETCLFC